MRKKIEIDEKLICEEYTETNIGIETIALKYHVGKLRIKEVLTKHGS